MNVTEAVHRRKSVRQFLSTPVADDTLRQLLTDASRAPSGGNVQPWRIYVVNGESMGRLREHLAAQPPMDAPEYEIYPAGLTEPYRTNRFTIGEQMYATLGIAREDKDGRRRQFAHNAASALNSQARSSDRDSRRAGSRSTVDRSWRHC